MHKGTRKLRLKVVKLHRLRIVKFGKGLCSEVDDLLGTSESYKQIVHSVSLRFESRSTTDKQTEAYQMCSGSQLGWKGVGGEDGEDPLLRE
jgi:hypothetical protein